MAGFCPGCGNALAQGAHYCSRCGRALASVSRRSGWFDRWLIPILTGLVIGLAMLVGFLLLGRERDERPALAPARSKPPAASSTAAPPPRNPAPVAVPPASNRSAGWRDEIRARQQHGPSSYYVIVGSYPEHDPLALVRAEDFRRCSGYAPAIARSSDIAGLRGGLTVVMLGGLAERRFAAEVLSWALRCQPDAYLRQGSFAGAPG
jgi:hypothetical protein